MKRKNRSSGMVFAGIIMAAIVAAYAACALAAPGSDATAEFKISGDGKTAEQKRAGNW